MLEGISSSESVATHQSKTSLLAIKLAAEGERQIADLLSQRVQETKAAAQPGANPPFLGQNVDTYA
jgi:hypothetical protein